MFTVAYSIAKTTRQPEKAWTLVKFLTNKASQEAVAHSVQAIPARRSAATSEAFVKPKGFAHMAYEVAATPHTDAVAYSRFSPRFATSSKAKDEFNRGVEALWTSLDPERRNARRLLEELQPRIEAIVAGER
jgi:ABC-type glycerol-3-phosphate transport system substrate-binding protein